MRKILFVGLILLFVASCEKENPQVLPTETGVYIINEGNFNFGSADVSVYNADKQEVTNEIFYTANSYSLGDVAQSMYVIDSTGYVVVNNSAKIEVVKLPSFTVIKTISIPGSSPRYFLPVSDSVAYVTELYAKKIWVVNFISGTLVTSIYTTGWTEKMFLLNGNVFVQQRTVSTDASTDNKLLKINPGSNSIADSKSFLKRDINAMEIDGSGNIWLAMDEDSINGFKSALLCYDQSLSLLKTLSHSNYGHHFSQLCIDKANGKMIYLDNDLFTANTTDASLSGQVFVSKGSKNIYVVALNSANGDVYVCDALDFVQRSRIYRYDKNGNEVHSFTAGVISGNFIFNE